MAKRTLQSCWKQYEKLVSKYLDNPSEDNLAAICDLTEKANADGLGDSLFALFVKPHLPLDLAVVFDCPLEEDGSLPRWKTFYSSEKQQVLVHPITSMKYILGLSDIVLEETDDFLLLRWLSFQKEISKLPTIYHLFMLVLQRVAYLLEIAHLEKRGGIVEVAESEVYHTFLWAFKELERFVLTNWGVEIRSHYNISWYESEWITGR